MNVAPTAEAEATAPAGTYSNLPCAVDKLNSYRKYGETSTLSQSSKYGIFRTGIWYEWSTSNRYQIPSDPITHYDQPVPKFHENYWINSYNPFAEYEWHATSELSVTAGFKYAYYTFALKQYADDGSVVGVLPNNAPLVSSERGFRLRPALGFGQLPHPQQLVRLRRLRQGR